VNLIKVVSAGVVSAIGVQSAVFSNVTYNDKALVTADTYRVLTTTPGTLSSFSPTSDITPLAACNGYNLDWAGSDTSQYYLCLFSDSSGTSFLGSIIINSVSYSQDIVGAEYASISSYYNAVCYGSYEESPFPVPIITSTCSSVGYTSSNCTNLVFGTVTPNPSTAPTNLPTEGPSVSLSPTIYPSTTPTVAPSLSPTFVPTVSPSITPTINPSVQPSIQPTVIPSETPTVTSTNSPSLTPTFVHIGSVNNQTQTQTQDNAETNFISSGVAAGIALGAAATMTAVGLFAYSAYKKYRQKQDNKDSLLNNVLGNDFNSQL